VLRLSVAALVLLAALAAGTTGLASPSAIEEKRAEGEQVLVEIQQLDSSLGLAVEAYNGASLRLDEISNELAATRRHLAVARAANRAAQANLQERLVALYQSGGDASTIEVLLGAENLDDLLNRLDTARRVSEQDAAILREVRVARQSIQQQERRLENAESEQKRVVADRAARKAEIEAGLAERQRLYESIQDEVEQLEAEERARQRRLEEEAKRRQDERERLAREAAAAGVDASIVASDSGISTPQGIGTSPGSALGSRVVAIAMQYLGIPYVWGGASPGQGFDCSGLTMYVFAQVGVSLPHYAASQYTLGVAISRDQLQPGDLVFFNGLGHMGMYIGSGQFIHAPHTGDVVKISSLDDPWYASTWVGARRVL